MVNRNIRPMTEEERERAKVKPEANHQESYHNYILRRLREEKDANV